MTTVDNIIAAAQKELGKPYVYGAEGPGSFDCSGLMQYVFSQVGISLPRTAAQQQDATTRVSSPAPGDLVFWGNPAYHVALYIGGGKIIAAPDVGERVQIQNMWGQPSGYGRVNGSGAGIAPAIDAVSTAVQTVSNPIGNAVSSALGGARNIVIEIGFVLLGAGLVGYGLYRGVSPIYKKNLGLGS